MYFFLRRGDTCAEGENQRDKVKRQFAALVTRSARFGSNFYFQPLQGVLDLGGENLRFNLSFILSVLDI